jgi:hypothetical protein
VRDVEDDLDVSTVMGSLAPAGSLSAIAWPGAPESAASVSAG